MCNCVIHVELVIRREVEPKWVARMERSHISVKLVQRTVRPGSVRPAESSDGRRFPGDETACVTCTRHLNSSLSLDSQC